MYVFVYGSLRKGLENHDYLEDSEFVGYSATDGLLYDTGYGYPGMVRGHGTVYGEVYRVDRKTLERLDDLEDFPEMYGRELRQFTLSDGSTVSAYVYIYNDEAELAGRGVRVISGDWAAYWRREGKCP